MNLSLDNRKRIRGGKNTAGQEQEAHDKRRDILEGPEEIFQREYDEEFFERESDDLD